MTSEKLQTVIDTYRAKFLAMGIPKIDFPHERILDIPVLGLGHCHGMLDRMEEFIKENRLDKVYRWLGFIQGVLWIQKIYTLDDLMNHNRP
jgi:hypothetical protein